MRSSRRFVLLFLVVWVWACAVPPAAPASPAAADAAFLDDLARRSWQYLSSDWATDHHLPWSWRSATVAGGDYANPAEIGLVLLAWVGAYELQRPWSPAWDEVEAEVGAALDLLRAWQTGAQAATPHGPNAYQGSVFYQWYWVGWDPPVVGADAPGSTNQAVPAIDNAWLAASLITIRAYGRAEGHPRLAQQADAILQAMDFRLWYHPATQRFSWGARHDPQGGGEADLYSNENRIINVVARALGDLSAEEFAASIAALDGDPGAYGGHSVAQLAWDGSLFTYLAPALFLREHATAYGAATLEPVVRAQRAYAAERGYAAWGLSDCFDIGAGPYVQQGAPPSAGPGPQETRPGVVTAHASALALLTAQAPEATSNLRQLAERFPAAYHADYGFSDSVQADPASPDYGRPSERFSALGQAWLFLALVDHEREVIWRLFYQDAGVMTAHIELYGGARVALPLVLVAPQPATPRAPARGASQT